LKLTKRYENLERDFQQQQNEYAQHIINLENDQKVLEHKNAQLVNQNNNLLQKNKSLAQDLEKRNNTIESLQVEQLSLFTQVESKMEDTKANSLNEVSKYKKQILELQGLVSSLMREKHDLVNAGNMSLLQKDKAILIQELGYIKEKHMQSLNQVQLQKKTISNMESQLKNVFSQKYSPTKTANKSMFDSDSKPNVASTSFKETPKKQNRMNSSVEYSQRSYRSEREHVMNSSLPKTFTPRQQKTKDCGRCGKTKEKVCSFLNP